MVAFRVEQLVGPIDTGPGWGPQCWYYRFGPDEVKDIPFEKSGGYDPDDPMAPFWKLWFADRHLRFAGGRYVITAYAHHGGRNGRCIPPWKTLAASVAIEVLPPPGVSPDSSPAASPAPGPTPSQAAAPSASAIPVATFDVFTESPTTTVSLGLYSGLPDPSWALSDEESTALTALLESLPRVDGSAPSGGLGYHGFTIERLTPEGKPRLLVAFEGTVSDPLSSHLSYLDDPGRSVERFLLESGRDQLSAVEIMSPGLDLPAG